jgi:Phosphotransferase enzyme family
MNQELDAAGEFDGPALARLADWLNMQCCRGSGRPALKRLSGGQSNPTYELLWADRSFILRRKLIGRLAPKAHQVEREYRVLSALRVSEVPVPRVRCLCEDVSILGALAYAARPVSRFGRRRFRRARNTYRVSVPRAILPEARLDPHVGIARLSGVQFFPPRGNPARRCQARLGWKCQLC